ncbi:hypothetical protein [Streptomyces xanthophaeus]|uniref:hypothetical protein n=1 Tax=Streptomyces xanthophaeus TaxID=67385 RepID=UPI003F4CE387
MNAYPPIADHSMVGDPQTAVLVTRFTAPGGVGEVADFMAPLNTTTPTDRHRLVRAVRAVRGTLDFSLDCRPRFDYGRAPPTLEQVDEASACSCRPWPPHACPNGTHNAPSS